MRVDASAVLAQGGVKIQSGNDAVSSLKKGDVIKAAVVSSDKNGAVTLKVDSGQSFSAKLGMDVKLSPGDVILLEVTENNKGQVSLSYNGLAGEDDVSTSGKENLTKDFNDKSLGVFANKLSELKMPVTEESARMMRELMAQNPGLKLEEAAFLASNKIVGDESLMKAALSVLGNGDKTDVMIAKLISLLGEQLSSASDGDLLRTLDSGAEGAKLQNAVSPGESGAPFTVNTANSTPLTDLLTTIVKNFSGVFSASTGSEPAPGAITQTIISQPNANMQINAENTQNILENPLQNEGQNQQQQGVAGLQKELTDSVNIGGQANPSEAQPAVANTSETVANTTNAQTAQNSQASSGQAGISQQNTPVSHQAESAPPGPAASAPQTTQELGGLVARVLSDIPEFSGTPQAALQRFSEMLLRVAGDNKEAADTTEDLMNQLNKLFTKVGREDADAGARLRDAREEMFTRLALIEESMSRAASPARAEMLMQTQKLMDHVRLINSIEQFVYMQLPVQLSEEKKSADLYVFKRKGRKNSDPDNVNILLAIDLEFMGHWEALVNIKNKDVSIQMEVPGEAEKDHFNSNTVLLHNMLDEAGFKLVSTNIKFSKEETTPLTALSTLDRYTGLRQGIIDFKI